jgi:hypothetical protein
MDKQLSPFEQAKIRSGDLRSKKTKFMQELIGNGDFITTLNMIVVSNKLKRIAESKKEVQS